MANGQVKRVIRRYAPHKVLDALISWALESWLRVSLGAP